MMMKEQIDTVLERVQFWPKSRQEDAVRLLLTMEAQGTDPYVLSSEERADLAAALDEAEQGDFAPDEEVVALFARFRE